MQFEWDRRKAASNVAKHGVSFEDATGVFGNLLSITIDDPDHSRVEQRYVTFGCTPDGTHIVVAHADNDDTIRIISARKMTRSEKQHYEQ